MLLPLLYTAVSYYILDSGFWKGLILFIPSNMVRTYDVYWQRRILLSRFLCILKVAIRFRNSAWLFGGMDCTMRGGRSYNENDHTIFLYGFWIELAVYCDCWWYQRRRGYIQQHHFQWSRRQWSGSSHEELLRYHTKLRGCKRVSVQQICRSSFRFDTIWFVSTAGVLTNLTEFINIHCSCSFCGICCVTLQFQLVEYIKYLKWSVDVNKIHIFHFEVGRRCKFSCCNDFINAHTMDVRI